MKAVSTRLGIEARHRWRAWLSLALLLAITLLIVPAALLLANVLAIYPGRSAGRTRPAVVLRSE
ncbi:MAG: hypothetical protein ACRDJ1_05740 [Actinomycetota bacterium]